MAKAKTLGLAAAKVASSSLDKITAEFLEEQLYLAHPELRTAATPTAAPAPQPVNEPIIVASKPLLRLRRPMSRSWPS